ncbi:MAG: hypothetical protein ACMXYM_05290 [Candidatus Woesearchaeota archaeon]
MTNSRTVNTEAQSAQANSRTQTRTKTRERTITLEDDVDELIGAYQHRGQPLVAITYKTPSFGSAKQVYRSVDKVRESESTLADQLGAHKRTEREMLREYGYENVPVLLRPIEAMRRRFMISEEDTLEHIARIGTFYADSLEELNGTLNTVLKEYERASSKVEAYVLHLEDQRVSLADRKDSVDRQLEAIEHVREEYMASAPHEGTYAEKVLWKRGLRAIEKDERSLRSLKLRVTQDLNQATEHHTIALQLAEGLEVSYTMNAMAVSTSEMLTDHLRMNIDAYVTSSKASDHAIRIHTYLEKAAGFSSLMSRATSERMSTVGRMFERFTLPGGTGAQDIARGGLLDGLRVHLGHMQEAHDAVSETYERDLLP